MSILDDLFSDFEPNQEEQGKYNAENDTEIINESFVWSVNDHHQEEH